MLHYARMARRWLQEEDFVLIDQLLQHYWDESMGGNPDLERFVKNVAAGKFGNVSAADITAFLQEVEAITIANIETKASEGGPFAALREQVIEETRAQVTALIREYGE